MTPKAKLLIIGGAEDKGDNEPLDILDQKRNLHVMRFSMNYCLHQIRK